MPIPGDAPPGVAALLRRCLDPEPSRRPTFGAVLHEVEGLMLQHRAARSASLPAAASSPAVPPAERRRPASVEASRADIPALQRRTPSPPAPQKQAAAAAPVPDREQLRERQRQLVQEQEEWLRRHERPPAPAAPAPLMVAAPARAPFLPSPFASPPAPEASPPATAPAAPLARAPTLPSPFGEQGVQQV